MVKAWHQKFFSLVHGNRLIYNTCWEDPRIDRKLLNLGPESSVVVITSAGCNVLDYLLDGPAAIHAIDVNFRQNALLCLKLALIRHGDQALLFSLFGNGGARPIGKSMPGCGGACLVGPGIIGTPKSIISGRGGFANPSTGGARPGTSPGCSTPSWWGWDAWGAPWRPC
jgi:hypothetical protein